MIATRTLRSELRLGSLQREAIVPAAALGVGLLLFAVSGRLGSAPIIPIYAPLVDMAIVVGLLVVAAVAGMDVMVRRDGRSLPIVAIAVAAAAMGLPHMLSFPLTLLGQRGTAQGASLVLDVVQIATPALLLVVFLRPATALVDPRRALQRTGLEALGFGLLCAGTALVAAPLIPPLVDGLRYTSVHTALQFVSIVPTIAAIVVFLLGHRADRRMELSLAAALILLSFGQLTSMSDAALFDGRWYMSNLFRFLPVAALMVGQLTLYADVVKVERRRVQHLGLVHRITGELAGGNDLDALLGEVVVSAVDLVADLRGVTGPRAVLVRLEAGLATPIAERDGASAAVAQAPFRTSGSALLSAVLRGGSAAEARLSGADSHHDEPLARPEVAWIAYAPVRVRGGVVGALGVTTRSQPARDAEVLPLLQGIADLAGIAIRNSQDYRTVGDKTADLLSGLLQAPVARDVGLPAIAGETGLQVGAFVDNREAVLASDVLVQQLQERSAQLEAANRVKSDFLSAVSHELRTPVSVVIAYADLLRQPGSLAAVGTLSAIDEIATAGERLGRLIDDLLEYSHLQGGEVLSHRKPVELGALVGSVVGGLEMAATAKSLVLQLRAPQEEVVVLADPEQVRNVLLQLVSNALKFTDCGGVVVTVEDRGDDARVTVEDTGVGIAADDLEVIFQQFRQADEGRSRRFGGAGLGLSIARSLVEMQGGQLGVTSTPGTGTSFWFTLPAPQPM